MVFYRKYRSQTIDELDSVAVRETLFAVLQKNIPHAFIFTGPKGLGKTSTARIVAKVVNCESKLKVKEVRDNSQSSTLNSQLIEPCNTCDQCVSITNGTNFDILEIDAASNRGIDEIRDLKEKIRLSPVSAQKKVYIIDEVHMLTTEAFNALLKTLEEPPEHAIFILCTTEPQKIPSTILSRCFHIAFAPATSEELVRAFKRIIVGEKAEVTDEALLMIARLSDGGFRDGTKMLEELLTLSGKKPVTKEFIEEKFQVSSIKYLVFQMIESLAAKDVQESLRVTIQLTEKGIDIKYFLQQLMEALHQMLLTQVKVAKVKYEIPKTKLSIAEIQLLFGLLTKAYGEMKFAVLTQLPLELVVIEWCEASSQPNSQVTEEPKTTNPKSVIDDDVTVSSLRKQVAQLKRQNALYGSSDTAKEEKIVIETTTVELQHTSGDGTVSKEWLDAFWKSLLVEMKKHNHTVAGVLRGCTIKSYEKEQLIIETAYSFHKEKLEEMKNREVLLKTCKLLTGNEMEIRVELKQ